MIHAPLAAPIFFELERGDRALICANGFFGGRMKNIVERIGADAAVIEAPWGSAFSPMQIEAALKKFKNVKAVAIVHAETSTGVLQRMEDIGEIVHNAGALLILDCVTSLGGAEVAVDAWGVDAAYSGTQKCLGCPPGLSPFTLSERAMEKIRSRKTPVGSFYLDALELEKYWSGERRVYHHTASAPMYCALLEGLKMMHEEGLTARWERHRLNGNAMRAGLATLGFSFLAQNDCTLPHVVTPLLPARVNDALARRELLQLYNTEIGGGLGDYAGKMWRIGVMGESSRKEHVIPMLASTEAVLAKNKWSNKTGAGVNAAEEYYRANK